MNSISQCWIVLFMEVNPSPLYKLGCMDTPFLVSCRCQTRVGHQNGYDSPNSSVRRVSLFFFFFFSLLRHGIDVVSTRLRHGSDTAPTRQQWKKKITNVWPLTSARCRCRCRCPPLLVIARSGQSVSSSSLHLRLPLLLFLFLCSLTQMPSSSVFFFCFFYVFFFFFVHCNFSNTFLYFLFVLWVFCQPHVKVTLISTICQSWCLWYTIDPKENNLYYYFDYYF